VVLLRACGSPLTPIVACRKGDCGMQKGLWHAHEDRDMLWRIVACRRPTLATSNSLCGGCAFHVVSYHCIEWVDPALLGPRIGMLRLATVVIGLCVSRCCAVSPMYGSFDTLCMCSTRITAWQCAISTCFATMAPAVGCWA
jgi:hypothetical protein